MIIEYVKLETSKGEFILWNYRQYSIPPSVILAADSGDDSKRQMLANFEQLVHFVLPADATAGERTDLEWLWALLTARS